MNSNYLHLYDLADLAVPFFVATGPSSDDADSENMFPQRGLAKTSTKTTTLTALQDVRLHIPQSREGLPLLDASPSKTSKEPLVEMQEVRIRYGDKEILGRWDHETGGEMKRGLAWTVRRGERWGLFGPNGRCNGLLQHQVQAHNCKDPEKPHYFL